MVSFLALHNCGTLFWFLASQLPMIFKNFQFTLLLNPIILLSFQRIKFFSFFLIPSNPLLLNCIIALLGVK